MTYRRYITKPLICSILAAVMAMTAACGGEAAENVVTESTDTTETTAAETTALTDSVPELDFDGAQFRTIEQSSTSYGMYTAEANGDVVNDAIFDRNRAIEERFNIVFAETQRLPYGEISTMVNKSVMSGSDEFDLVFGQMYQSAKDAQSGVYLDWNTIPYVDFDKPWYVKSISDAAVGGKLYLIESELSLGYSQQTWMMLYNKTKADELGNIPDLYQIVEDGGWTLDLLNQLTADVYQDLNGDTVRDDNDFYGFAGTPGGCLLAAFMYGADAKIAEVNSDLKVEQLIDSEKTLDVLSTMSELFYTNSGTIFWNEALRGTGRVLFPKSVVLFSAMQVNDLVREDFGMRNMADEFGVLPLPKYDEAQAEYYTVVDGGSDIMVVPATVTNTELVGAIVEAMSAASYNDVIPAYIGQAIEQKGTRDEESIMIMREILDSRVIDFAYLYDGFSGWVMKLPSIIKNQSAIVSSIENQMNAMEAYYQEVVDTMSELE